MGFPHLAIRTADFLSTTCLLNLLSFMRILIVAVFTKLHILSPKEEEDISDEDFFNTESPTNQVILIGGLSPTLVPAEIIIPMIKERLPVLHYSSFLEKSSQGQEEHEDSICMVCLDPIEKSHEIRELCNCCHVFHKECLDCWLDEGQVTCPLCRSMLLPEHKREKIIKGKGYL